MKNLNMSMDILGSDGKNINIMLDDMEVRNHILNPTISHENAVIKVKKIIK